MSLAPVLERLSRGDTLVADGAMGTMLMARGLRSGHCPESATLEHPEWIEAIAAAYLDAGAEIIKTNTFGGNPVRLADFGLEDQTDKINTAAVRHARRAVGSRAMVAASCGPTGLATRLPSKIPRETVRKAYERQLRAILSAGVDLILFETMSDLVEITTAIETAKRLAPRIPIAACMTFDTTPEGFRTFRGVTVEVACCAIKEAGANLAGANCCEGSSQMVEIAREFRRYTCLPLIMQPNAGLPTRKDGRLVYPETPEYMAGQVARMLDMGVQIVGGCCGTTADHIRALRTLVDQRKKR